MSDGSVTDSRYSEKTIMEFPDHIVHITDSWKEIIESVHNGTYKDKYHIGDTKELDLGPEGIVEMQIVAFNADRLANDDGRAAITWISKQLLKSEFRMNPEIQMFMNRNVPYQVGTGIVIGWEYSELRAWINNEIKPLIPVIVRDAIKPVLKSSKSVIYSGENTFKNKDTISIDDVWIPSYQELQTYPFSDPLGNLTYSDFFISEEDWMKFKNDTLKYSWWWVRDISFFSDDVHYFIAGADEFLGIEINLFDNIFRKRDLFNSIALGFCI